MGHSHEIKHQEQLVGFASSFVKSEVSYPNLSMTKPNLPTWTITINLFLSLFADCLSISRSFINPATMAQFRAKKLDLGCYVNVRIIRDHTKRSVALLQQAGVVAHFIQKSIRTVRDRTVH